MTTHTTVAVSQREPRLLGQTVVVIGGSAGIGLETAQLARAEGADVILTGRTPERLEHAAREISARTTADQVRDALADHVGLGLDVARNAAPKMRPGGTLLLMGGTGGRRISRELGIASAATAALPPFVAA